MATQEQFETFYETNLKPKLVAFEKQRQAIISKLKSMLLIYAVLIILAIFVFTTTESLACCFSIKNAIPLTIVSLIIIFVEIIIFYNQMLSSYKKPFKKEVVASIVTFIDENLTYNPNKKIAVDAFETSQLFEDQYDGTVNKWTGEDYVEGILGKTLLKFSEIKAYDESKFRDSDDNKDYDLIFKGLFFIFHFDWHFEGVTQILPKSPPSFFEKIFPSWLSQKTHQPSVMFSDPEIEREFVVYSDNPIKARNVLTIHFMRRLLAFRHRIKKPAYLSFVDGKLYMAIEVQKNLFEPPVFNTLLNFELIQAFFEYMQIGKEIVEYFNTYLKK